MKQSSFEIRQRAEELIRNAISIWRQSDNGELLEGIENDPVFSMMLTAIAHESNDMDAQITRFRQGIYEEFSQMMMPYGIGGAMPATVAVTLMPAEGIASVHFTDTSAFSIDGTSYTMIPLLESTAINLRVSSMQRVDGRHWSIGLDFASMVSDLSGWTFAIEEAEFSGLKLSVEGHDVPLMYPWNYADMPFVKCFSLDGMLYNHTPVYDPSITCMDLFAKQNLRLFYVRNLKLSQPVNHLDLVLEFEGIESNFVFKSSFFRPNAIILVNAQNRDVTLDFNNPIFRVEDNKYLMHLIRPEDDQIFGKAKVEVRRLGADRFNEASLINLLQLLINRFNSDYYAFLAYNEKEIDEFVTKLQMLVERMSRNLESKAENRTEGTYIMLGGTFKQKQVSVNVHYVVTDADACNDALNQNTTFSTLDTVDPASIKMILTPTLGYGELSNRMSRFECAKYYMSCNDRIVTPADIKIFCYTVLMTRFGIAREMITGVDVSRKFDSSSASGYSIYVIVGLKESPFIKDFSSRIHSAQIIIEKMLSVRSMGIYPIKLKLVINN